MLKRFENLAIGTRLNLIVISITILTLMVVIYITLFSTAEALGNEAEGIAIDQNRAIGIELENNLKHVTSILDTIASEANVTPSDIDVAAFDVAVNRIMQQQNNLTLRRIVVYIPDHPLTVYNFPNMSTGATSLISRFNTSRLPDDYWIYEVFEDSGRGWYGPFQPPYAQINETTMSTAIPYLNGSGDVIAVLWADIVVNTLNTNLRNSIQIRQSRITGGGEYHLLLTDDGDLITGLNTREIPLRQINFITERMKGRPSGTLTEFGQEDVVAITYRATPMNWTYVSVFPSDNFNILPSETVGSVLFISVLGLLFMIWAVNQVVTRTLVKPLNELGTAAMEMGSGDLRRVIDYQDHYDEVGQLARTLEDMRNSLKYSYDTLEHRIERRTAELDLARAKAQSTAQELRAVYDESLSVVSDYQLEPILNTFTQRIVTLMNSDYCSVWLTRTNGTEVRRVAQVHLEENTMTIVDRDNSPIIEIGQGMVGMTVRTGQPIIVDHYSTWEHRLQPPVTDNIERVLCVPLLSSGQTLGAVMTARRGDGIPFTESEQRLLSLFANMVSPSVRNAQLIVQIEAARKEADRANLVKTRFLASVTHELRTPLNLIINNMDFMRVGTFGEVNEEQGNRLDQTIRSAEHLLYLINDLLDVSKIDAGEMQLFIQPTELNPIIEDALDSALMILEKEKKEQDILLSVEIEAYLPLIPMDARRVRQVLTNLLSNAIKFTMKGEVRLEVTRESDHVTFKVIDTGIGIPDSEKDKLFQPFERTNTAKSLGIEGTGLGLQISKHLVEQHGGEIWFESTPDVGTTFIFTVPLSKTDEVRSSRTQLMQVFLDEDFSEDETEEISIDHRLE